MQEIRCAICEKKGNFKLLYKANFDVNQFNKETFSARRIPDRTHYQLVKCNECDLVFSNPILEEQEIKDLYVKSDFTYDDQTSDLTKTYVFYLKKLDLFTGSKERFLEIGCGNGFLLEEARKLGFKEVYGVEPSLDSVKKAKVEVRKNIVCDIFKEGLFKKNFFDVVCFFQTFDHIPNPNEFLREVYKILKPGGLVLAYNHNISSFSARTLGESCPMVDVEHIYLYDKQTIKKIFQKHKFSVLEVGDSFNIHSLSYWLRMFPLPSFLKSNLINLAQMTKLGNLRIKVSAGNLYLVAKK